MSGLLMKGCTMLLLMAAFSHVAQGGTRRTWQSGVNADDADDVVFTAEIEVVDGKPVVTWKPDSPELRATRLYTTYGKKTLLGREWTPETDCNRGDYNFFKVEVKMK